MNVLTAELHTLATQLGAAGVPTTLDPGQVLTLVTQTDVCALVEPSSSYLPLTFGGDFSLTVPVWLITASPYDPAAAERLDEALVAVWQVVRPVEPVTRDTWRSGDTDMPALLIPTPRHVDCT